MFTKTELDAGLKKLKIADKMRKEAEQSKADHKKASKERKLQNEALEKQWKLDMDAYAIREAAWHVECAAMEAEWNEQRDEARKIHKHCGGATLGRTPILGCTQEPREKLPIA